MLARCFKSIYTKVKKIENREKLLAAYFTFHTYLQKNLELSIAMLKEVKQSERGEKGKRGKEKGRQRETCRKEYACMYSKMESLDRDHQLTVIQLLPQVLIFHYPLLVDGRNYGKWRNTDAKLNL